MAICQLLFGFQSYIGEIGGMQLKWQGFGFCSKGQFSVMICLLFGQWRENGTHLVHDFLPMVYFDVFTFLTFGYNFLTCIEDIEWKLWMPKPKKCLYYLV